MSMIIPALSLSLSLITATGVHARTPPTLPGPLAQGPEKLQKLAPFLLSLLFALALDTPVHVDAQQCDPRDGLVKCRTGVGLYTRQPCIAAQYLCNGQVDCEDKSDEDVFVCGASCNQDHEFTCADRASCVPFGYMCDGRASCADKSDEDPEKCSQVQQFIAQRTTSSTSVAPVDASCIGIKFYCKEQAQCIAPTEECDGVVQCAGKCHRVSRCLAASAPWCRAVPLCVAAVVPLCRCVSLPWCPGVCLMCWWRVCAWYCLLRAGSCLPCRPLADGVSNDPWSIRTPPLLVNLCSNYATPHHTTPHHTTLPHHRTTL